MTVPAVGTAHDLALAQLVLNAHVFDPAKAVKEHDCARLQATRECLAVQLQALKQDEPKLDGDQSKLLRKYLTVIATAMMPTMSGPQASAWLNAVIARLSDLPARCTHEAASQAVHRAFGYITEVEQFIRAKAEELRKQQLVAIYRLDLMQAELHRLRNPQPTLGPPDMEPMSDDEVHEWQAKGQIGRAVLRMGLAGGWVKPSQLSEPLPPEDERKSG